MSGARTENDLQVTIGPFRLRCPVAAGVGPRSTCACVFRAAYFPYRCRTIHVRWSGLGCWIPLGFEKLSFPFENATSYPAPGEFIFYPGGYGEAEILLSPMAFQSTLQASASSLRRGSRRETRF